jgi:glycosyltransferase involved in cell wall biosynthesis
MRIAFVARRWWPAAGGAEAYARHLAHGLAAGNDVTVVAFTTDSRPASDLTDSLSPPPSFEAFADGSVRVVPLRIPGWRRALLAPLGIQVLPGMRRVAYGQTRRAAARLYAAAVAPVIAKLVVGADIVHMWGSDFVAAAAMAAANQVSVPAVVTPFAHAGQWGDDPGSAAAFRRAETVISLLESEAALYQRLGVREARLAICGVCSPGVEAGEGDAMRRRFEIEGPLVVFLGVRRAYKGFDVLLEASSQVEARHPGTTFAFIGPGGPLSGASTARVIDAGPADERQKAAWLDAADLLCLPSAGEIFPVSFLEAWSVRTPVVTAATPTLQELIGKSGGGVAVPRRAEAVADAIVGLLEDPKRRAALGAAGYRFWSRRHTVEAVTRCHEQIYSRLVTAART